MIHWLPRMSLFSCPHHFMKKIKIHIYIYIHTFKQIYTVKCHFASKYVCALYLYMYIDIYSILFFSHIYIYLYIYMRMLLYFYTTYIPYWDPHMDTSRGICWRAICVNGSLPKISFQTETSVGSWGTCSSIAAGVELDKDSRYGWAAVGFEPSSELHSSHWGLNGWG